MARPAATHCWEPGCGGSAVDDAGRPGHSAVSGCSKPIIPRVFAEDAAAAEEFFDLKSNSSSSSYSSSYGSEAQLLLAGREGFFRSQGSALSLYGGSPTAGCSPPPTLLACINGTQQPHCLLDGKQQHPEIEVAPPAAAEDEDDEEMQQLLLAWGPGGHRYSSSSSSTAANGAPTAWRPAWDSLAHVDSLGVLSAGGATTGSCQQAAAVTPAAAAATHCCIDVPAPELPMQCGIAGSGSSSSSQSVLHLRLHDSAASLSCAQWRPSCQQRMEPQAWPEEPDCPAAGAAADSKRAAWMPELLGTPPPGKASAEAPDTSSSSMATDVDAACVIEAPAQDDACCPHASSEQQAAKPAVAQLAAAAAAAAAPRQPPAWRQMVSFALPMLATLAADPLASLVDTMYVGRLGAAQLAGVGLALNVFQTVTRLLNAPLLAVTTSTVAAAAAAAEAESGGGGAAAEAAGAPDARTGESTSGGGGAGGSVAVDDGADVESELATPLLAHAEPENCCSAAVAATAGRSGGGSSSSSRLSEAVSSALLLALLFSLLEVVVLTPFAGRLVSLWGAVPGGASATVHAPAAAFLAWRAVGAPVTVLLLVLQGVFRGLSDARTPLFATLAVNALNIALEPALIFPPAALGVRGSAAATCLAQALPLAGLLYVARRRHGLGLGRLWRVRLSWRQVAAVFRPTGYLLLRTVSVSACYAVATSLVARAGPVAAAAHQVAFQIWLATSLLADALAIACQTLLARAAAAHDLPLARALAASAVWLSLLLGCGLAAGLHAGASALPALFSADAGVVALVGALMPIVAGSQLLNSLAFTLDGVLYGAGGFRYAAAQMLLCAGPSLAVMFAGQPGRPAGVGGAPPRLSGLASPAAVNVSMVALADSSREGPFTAAASSSSQAGGTWGAAVCALVQRASLQGPSSAAYYAGGSSDAAAASAIGGVGWGGGGGLVAVTPQQQLPAAAAPTEATLPPALLWVWAGLCCLMALRAATILLPLACRCYPFAGLFEDLRPPAKQQHQQQQRAKQQGVEGAPAADE